ncbi:hypothetical protein [Brevibacillus laterosporus]|uniref:hypothetical protein n=1 Tax=Brevibacillus laterosporus TaxID=1465 RepID=UPI003D239760
MNLTLDRHSLTNVDDPAGVWQYEGGRVFEGNNYIANYAEYEAYRKSGNYSAEYGNADIDSFL